MGDSEEVRVEVSGAPGDGRSFSGGTFVSGCSILIMRSDLPKYMRRSLRRGVADDTVGEAGGGATGTGGDRRTPEGRPSAIAGGGAGRSEGETRQRDESFGAAGEKDSRRQAVSASVRETGTSERQQSQRQRAA